MKRFYREVTVAPQDGGWQVMLDGRGVKTPSGAPQIVPSNPLADALAQEWRTQGEEIDLTAFVFRDMADYAIDRVAADPAEVVRATLAFAETDTLCYRAEEGEALRRRQEAAWEPLVRDVEARLGCRFARVAGVMHRPQPPDTLARLREELEQQDAFALAALQTLASLGASLIVALAALDGDDDPDGEQDALFALANLEEDWQAQQWGWDGEALARRDHRLAGFAQARRFARLAAKR